MITAGNVFLVNADWEKFGDDVYFWSPDWQPTPEAIANGEWEDEILADLPSHWAIVDLRGPDPRLIVDRQRSRQLLAAQTDEGWMITDQIEALRGKVPFIEDPESSEVFKHFGHTVGSQTLVKNVWDAQAASITTLGAALESTPYRVYTPSETPVSSQADYSDSFKEATATVVQRLLDAVGDRQLVVPISAGLDSRLILTALRYLGAENVVTYSYGIPTSPQKPTSERVARELGYPFLFVEYDPEEIKKAWETEGSSDYARKAWGGTSLPFRQDWYAIKQLVENGSIQEGAIVLPGHSIPVAMASPEIFTESPDIDLVGEDVARATGSILAKPEEAAALPRFRKAVAGAAREVSFRTGTRDNLRLWQWLNLKDRQAKFITNSVRLYEHFGLSWAMPLHEPEIWAARESGSDALTKGRVGYKTFVNDFYAEVSGASAEPEELSPAPPPSKTAPSRPEVLSAVTRSRPVRFLHRRARKWIAYANPRKSPFGLEAFREDRPWWKVIRDTRNQVQGNALTVDWFLRQARGKDLALFDG